MNRILAIAGLTLRAAARSKVFALLAVLVLGGILGLPLVMQSDGSPAGQVRLFLEYTLGLTAALLSVLAVWTGAGAVSLEVAGRQIQLVAVKPVRALEIWAGKWLGLMAMNALLLAAAGALVYGLLAWTLRAEGFTDEDRAELRQEILAARRGVLPTPADAAGARTLAPGETGRWQFELPRGLRAGQGVFLAFRLVSSRPDLQDPVAVLWTIAADGGPGSEPARVFVAPNRDCSLRLRLPEGARRIEARCLNAEARVPVTLLFDAADSVRLDVNESRFEANYLRALLMILARLGFFSALGLTAGTAFSFPVAAFVSLALLLLAAVNRWLQPALAGLIAADEPGSAAALWDQVMRRVGVALNAILPPLDRLNPMDYLPAGRLIAWSLVGQAWILLAVAYVAALALLGAGWLSRRELGLPTE